MPAFIETQFPIARLSAESYKERKAVFSQTLTGLSKWWGRKPLILVRASILGMIMPASKDAKRDREIFLKILTMDDDGAWQRCKGEIPPSAWRDAASPEIQEEYFGGKGFQRGISDEEKDQICARIWESLNVEERAGLDAQRRRPVPDRNAFDSLPYADRIRYCERPENITGPTSVAWSEINAHLKTNAHSLPDLIKQLGEITYGHTPRVGDSFCGGGSIPFEAARIGCTSFGSDLNPVACLLTWASINLIGGGEEVQNRVRRLQETAFDAADRQITTWRLEHNSHGERADAYLYCVEVKPEGCDYYIPLAPSWVVSEKKRVVVKWERQLGGERLVPEIEVLTPHEFFQFQAESGGTITGSRIVDPFNRTRSWSVEALRGPDGLRRWDADQITPKAVDVFQERLFCIRWIDSQGDRRYAAPDADDLRREARALELLRERFADWQRQGFIPSKSIVAGYNTDQPIRERGWTHWHHLFTPRQLLLHGLIAENLPSKDPYSLARIGNLADFNSKLTRYPATQESINNTFSNQALNTVYNYPCRATGTARNAFIIKLSHPRLSTLDRATVRQCDARDITETCDFWITDPPYADAVNYHELGDYFLAWYDKKLARLFPDWTPDSRSELAVRGNGDDFRRSMVDVYRNLTRHMPDNGLQMVMFTHQDPAVWADLGMILWAAGLKATAAWTISTETEAAGIKKGSYVQGTVCLVLRKRSAGQPGFLDEIYPLVEDEVHRQIDSMRDLDEGGEPNFNDADYQLAAYAAALKVLTHYATIDGREVEHEVFAVRERGRKSDFEAVIERALGIACDYLVPRGLDAVWRDLSLAERYYLRALEIESRGERRKGMYEELARGFGVTDIKPLLKADKANGVTLLTPSGFGSGLLAAPTGATPIPGALPGRRGRGAGAPHPFATSATRHLLFAIRETVAADNSPEPGRQYLRDTYGPGIYWQHRERFIALLEWLAILSNAAGMGTWAADSSAARLLAGRLRNDQA